MARGICGLGDDQGAEPYAIDVAGPGEPAILWPGEGAVLYVDPRVPSEHRGIGLRATAPVGARRAVWRIDGAVLAEVGPPFHVTWPDPEPGDHRISLTIDDADAGTVLVHVQ